MKTQKLLKKLGYGYSISYNEYTKKYFVYKNGDWSLGTEIKPDSKISYHKKLKKSIKLYLKRFKKST
jgi:hypothetical protein